MYINRHGLQFSQRDTWDSSTLAAIIVKWLQAYKQDYAKHSYKGCPACYLANGSDCTYEEIEAGQALFMSDIDKMIWAFSVDDIPDDCWLIEPLEDKPIGSGELDWPKIESHRSLRAEGMKLFAERFDSLWI